MDSRWIAEVPDLPGVMVYGASREDAVAKAEALALRACWGLDGVGIVPLNLARTFGA